LAGGGDVTARILNSSAKSALHGLIHWLANSYAKKGITVNGIAPALIEQTKMLPGSNEELSKST
jgi:3-oxoacyl-[acyl-carrier protein] reductase